MFGMVGAELAEDARRFRCVDERHPAEVAEQRPGNGSATTPWYGVWE